MTVYANVSSVSPDFLSVLSGSSSRPLQLEAFELPAEKLTSKFAKKSRSSQSEAFDFLCELCGRSPRSLRFKIF